MTNKPQKVGESLDIMDCFRIRNIYMYYIYVHTSRKCKLIGDRSDPYDLTSL